MGSTSVLPARMAAAASRSFFLACSFPATIDKSKRLCTNSSSPPDSASISSFFLCARNFWVSGRRFWMAWEIRFWSCTRFRPAPSLASVRSVTSEPGGSVTPANCSRMNSSRSFSSGRGMAMEATPGCCTMPWLSSIWFSAIKQMVASARRKVGLLAQRFRITSELRSSPDMEETSPAGATVSAKSMTRAIFLPSAMRRRR